MKRTLGAVRATPHQNRAIFGGCACAPRGEDSPKGSRRPEAQSRPCAGFGPTRGFGRSDVSLAFWLLFLEKVTPVTRQYKQKGTFKLAAASNRPPHHRSAELLLKEKPTSSVFFLNNKSTPKR